MIQYRLLARADFEALHQCFLDAFSDYAVDMRISQQQFEQRIRRDGVKLELSAGAFDEGRMIAFCINGIGSWQEKPTAYDAGTGVVPNYRGQGVARELINFLIPRLKEAGVEQYLLEVLSSNMPAVSLYSKLGFIDTRMLAVFRDSERTLTNLEQVGKGASKARPRSDQRGCCPLPDLFLVSTDLFLVSTAEERVTLRRMAQVDWPLFQSFWDVQPSWQSSIAAVERVENERTIIGAYIDDRCVGYGVVFLPSANLMQLAVAPTHRRKRIGSALLAALQNELSETLKINNIDESSTGSLAFYEANNFKLVLRQHEMIRKL